VECLPVVQGGIARNSSKVRTRGLQHFQPVKSHMSIHIASNHHDNHDNHDAMNRAYPSVPHGRLEGRNDSDIVPQDQYTSCRMTGERIFGPF
jgi:hypothetical protein